MNPTLKEHLDILCAEQATTHAVPIPFINLIIQAHLIITKLGVIATFSKSSSIDVKESMDLVSNEVSNIVLLGAALSGFKPSDTNLVLGIYKSVVEKLMPLLNATYLTPQSEARN